MKDYRIYVTEEITKKAQEKGFVCEKYDEGDRLMGFCKSPKIYVPQDWCYYVIPTAEELCGWLRKEYNLFVHCNYKTHVYDGNTNKHTFKDFYYTINGKTIREFDGHFKSYEEALIEGINEALNLI